MLGFFLQDFQSCNSKEIIRSSVTMRGYGVLPRVSMMSISATKN